MCGDVRRLPCADAAFDAVISHSTPDHLSSAKELAGTLVDVARVLRPERNAYHHSGQSAPSPHQAEERPAGTFFQQNRFGPLIEPDGEHPLQAVPPVTQLHTWLGNSGDRLRDSRISSVLTRPWDHDSGLA
jgi:hypothetical protein